MKATVKTLTLAALVSVAGMSFATEGSVGVVKERQDLMGSLGGAMKTLGDMLKSGAIDEAAATAALTAIQDAARNIPVVFETEDLTQPTKAKAEIWTQFDAFKASAAGLEAAATAALAAPGDANALGAAMGAMGGTCQGCHTAFRL
jgi:cytochrome c556